LRAAASPAPVSVLRVVGRGYDRHSYHGIERRIDVADVNDRMLLNNVSLGIYGDAVRRPAYRDAKVRTLLATAEEVLGPSAQVPTATRRRRRA